MTPTEHELTVSTAAIARTIHGQFAAATPGWTPATFDQLSPLQRHKLLESALPFAIAALEALPDRAEAVLQRVEQRHCICDAWTRAIAVVTDQAHHLEHCPAPAIVQELGG
jgi:hypothetical protein